MKLFLQITLLLISQTLSAQNVTQHSGTENYSVISLGSYNITLPVGWLHRTETDSSQRAMTTIYHLDSTGTLKFKSLTLPQVVTQKNLRNMTNVDSSISLNWQKWGDFYGYNYDYNENGKIYRQWWLSNQEELLFFVYSNDSRNNFEKEIMTNIVMSISANN
jgi:hypothetical protein